MPLPHTIIRSVLNTPMSLAELQQITQVSLPTLRRAVQELMDARWIGVVGQAEARGGRPAMLLGPDPSRFLVVGVHLQLPGMRLIISDLTGEVVHEEKLFDRVVPSPDDAVQEVVNYVERAQSARMNRAMLGVGIASPGFTEPGTGDIISIGRVPTWENFPICRRLEAALGLPVRIANDVDCMAFAEFLHASEPREVNLAYVGYDEGVKVSMFLKGELYRGSLGNAGLIASHLLHAGDTYNVDDVHSLLTVIGINQRFDRMVAGLDSSEQRRYAKIVRTANPRERFRLILRGEDANLPICNEIADDLTATLAAAVANVVLLVQPDIVVIGGLLGAMRSERFAQLEASIRAHLPALISHNAIIRQGRLVTQNGAAIGATHHFVQEYLSDPSSPLSRPEWEESRETVAQQSGSA